MASTLSGKRRSSVSIYDYPEHLNPFSDDEVKPEKHKKHFWTFGRNKKRSSFSMKSTWNGLFGKRKETPDRRTTISTVSSSYPSYNREINKNENRVSRDQQEFDEALGTLTRRRKYTSLENGSRYSSSLTVNGDPARIYDGSPKDTTASIMGPLTPKPPARRFGQVSPRPKERIPALEFDDDDREMEKEFPEVEFRRVPVPPKRKSAQRLQTVLSVDNEENAEDNNAPSSFHDENENVRQDLGLERFNPVRQSNLSINSCMSVTSTTSYMRKKRKAPQPPVAQRKLEAIVVKNEEDNSIASEQHSNNESLDEQKSSSEEVTKNSIEENKETEKVEGEIKNDIEEVQSPVEICKEEQSRVEIHVDDSSKNEECSLVRKDSFSVKEEIEKIERQIKALEASAPEENEIENEKRNSRLLLQTNRRNFFKDMVAANEKSAASNEGEKELKIELKEVPKEEKDIRIVKLPENHEDVQENDVLRKPVKVIELHISEPIKTEINPIPKPRRHSESKEFYHGILGRTSRASF